ncbi:MAG TPA: hypothetical protein VF021_04550 [Longimicrobiales bacterium]
MRNVLLAVACITIAAGCARKEDQADVPADTMQMTPAAAAPTQVSLADLKGMWKMQTMPMDKDTVLVNYTLWVADDTMHWKMKFDNRADTIPVQVVHVMGDTIHTSVGPYASALRKNVKVVTESAYHLENGKLVGNVVAHYSVATADSVVQLRSTGTREQ